jgi:uncharacterized protein
MKNILAVRSGSRAYGCHNEDSDYDSTTIVIESMGKHMPINNQPFEALQDKQSHGDNHIYSLYKFVQLACQGNPNIIEVLYSPVTSYDRLGNELLERRDLFWSKNCGARFLGYMQAQKERLLGYRGQKDVNRKDLVEKYGYDTKYAYHIIRLGIIGRDYLTDGFISLPLRATDVSCLKAIREGKWKFGEVIQEAEELEQQLKDALLVSKAPLKPDTYNLQQWMENAYLSQWCVDFTY